MMKKRALFLILTALLVVSCSPPASRRLDEVYGKGFNGILWGERALEAAAWIRSQMEAPVKVIRQDNAQYLKEAPKMRKRYMKRLRLKAVPDLEDSLLVTYFYSGYQYVMSFDKESRFSAVTFGPSIPRLVPADDRRGKETLKAFEAKVLGPLVREYGRPEKFRVKEVGVERFYWVLRGRKVSLVLEYTHSKAAAKVPARWQYSETLLLASPKYYLA